MAIYQKAKVNNNLSMRFTHYNEALQFAQKSKALNPSKPFKRMIWKDGQIMPLWFVTLAKMPTMNRLEFVKLPDVKLCKLGKVCKQMNIQFLTLAEYL